MKRILARILPIRVVNSLRRYRNERSRRKKSPTMLWGYFDPVGGWRENTRISDSAFIYYPDRVRIADNVFVWHYTILDGTGGLSIGEGTQIGAWVGLFTHSSHIAIRLYGRHYTEVPEKDKRAYSIKPIKIGRFVFVGASVTVLPGVTIGDGALLSAGSVVTRNVSDFEIVSGNPASVIGDTRRLDSRYLSDPRIRAWHDEWQQN
jgi:acetyltransferase-like isoleucine patch superfamily enzyme